MMKKKILVIDDDPLNVRLIQITLQKKGYDVDFAHDGVSGLEKMMSFSPDLIILDIEMPHMNGYTFMLEVKKIEGALDIPVIVLTAHAQMQAIFELKGIKDYIVKPIDPEDLIEKIDAHIM